MDQPTRFAVRNHGAYCLAYPAGPSYQANEGGGPGAKAFKRPGLAGRLGARARHARMVLTRLKAAYNVPNVSPIASIGAYAYKAIRE